MDKKIEFSPVNELKLYLSKKWIKFLECDDLTLKYTFFKFFLLFLIIIKIQHNNWTIIF
jgi:hypothetical protein